MGNGEARLAGNGGVVVTAVGLVALTGITVGTSSCAVHFGQSTRWLTRRQSLTGQGGEFISIYCLIY